MAREASLSSRAKSTRLATLAAAWRKLDFKRGLSAQQRSAMNPTVPFNLAAVIMPVLGGGLDQWIYLSRQGSIGYV